MKTSDLLKCLILLCLVLVLIVNGCSKKSQTSEVSNALSDSIPAADDYVGPASLIDNFANNPINDKRLNTNIEFSSSDIEMIFGKPIKTEERIVASSIDPMRKGKVKSYEYEGMKYSWLINDNAKEILIAQEQTSNRILFSENIKMGMPKSEIIKMFGMPNDEKKDQITYYSTNAIYGIIAFRFRSNKLVFIGLYRNFE